MSLLSIGLENFKSVADEQRAAVSPLTFVYGRNASGKSTLFQALLLLRQSFLQSPAGPGVLVSRGADIDLGPARFLPNRSLRDLPTRFELEFRPNSDTSWAPGIGAERTRVRMEFLPRGDDPGLYQSSLEIQLGRGPALTFSRETVVGALEMFTADRPAISALRETFVGPATALPGVESAAEYLLGVEQIVFNPLGLLPGSIWDVRREPGASAGQADQPTVPGGPAVPAWNAFISRVASSLEALLKRICYLGPLRRSPSSFVVSADVPPAEVGAEGEHVVEMLAASEDLVADTNSWLVKLGVPYRLALEPLRTEADMASGLTALLLTDTRSEAVVDPRNVGFGISQLLPVVAQSLAGGEKVVCLEEPEVHIHPALQAALGDLFIGALRLNPNQQFLIETHSEHLMLRVRRRIRLGELDPASVSVLYVEPAQDGAARITRLRLDEDGEFVDEWPSGFFEERLEELF